MDCVLEASGQVRSRIETLLSLGIANSPMAGARIRVASGNFITAKPQGVIDGVDMELTGEVRRVDTNAIQQRLDDGDIVLISPLGYSPTGEIFILALEKSPFGAVRIDADKLMFLMKPEGCDRRKHADRLSAARCRSSGSGRAKLPPTCSSTFLRGPCLQQRRQACTLDQPSCRRRAAARLFRDGIGDGRATASRTSAMRRSTTSAAS
jgi:hypothetical protein